jgi:predicted ATPase/DNA-binding SARP family transcriptional activator
MDFRVLGPLEVRDGDQSVPIRTGRPRMLLVAMLLRLGERVRSEALIDLLWGDEAPRNSANALQILISYLRKTLPSDPSGGSAIETVDKGYRLVADRSNVDAYRMEDAVLSAAAAPDPRSCLSILDAALGEWRGAPAPELEGEPYAEADIARLQEVRLTLLEQRCEVLMELGDLSGALVSLQPLVAEHPLREKLSILLMTALYRSGRQADALEVYERARRNLVEELGIDPGPALQATAEAVLRQAPHLAPVDPSPASLSIEEPPRGGEQWRPLGELIGRSEEVQRLRKLMVYRRLVTLTGPGGAGKTRLAAHLATEATRSIWWADLAPTSTPENVLSQIARAVHVPVTSVEDVVGFAGQLSAHRGLLVLDTCERVRSAVKPVVEALLRACPGVRILATSRQPLGVATEVAWPVPPLSLPHPDDTSVQDVAESAAVQLFLERASSRRPDLVLTPQNAPDVGQICLLLDGLPLAIELAAAHAASLSASEMVKVLQDRLRILVDDDREERQSTLRTAIGWSFDQLDDDEARFFARLSVFTGAFPLDGALAVGGEGLRRDGLEVLLRLARQSLVVTASDRYRMLDTIRAFAAEKLRAEADEWTTTQRRHVEWYLRMLEEVGLTEDTNSVEGWRGELRDVLLDLSTALSWCFTSGETMLGARLLASVWWVWPREGVLEEAEPWFTEALGAVEETSPLYAAVLSSSASYAVSQGDLERALDQGQRAAQRLEAMGYGRAAARALLPVGIALWASGRYDEAAQVQDRTIALFEQVENGWGVALARVMRARTALEAGFEDAAERLASAELAARRTGDGHLLATALVQRARAMVASGRYVEGAALAEEGLALNDLHGHREGAVGALHTLGFAAVGQEELASASQTFTRALRAALAMHHRGATAESLDGLALVAGGEGRWLDAARLLARADLVRADSHIQRSLVSTTLLDPMKGAVESALSAEEMQRAAYEAAYLDLHQVM